MAKFDTVSMRARLAAGTVAMGAVLLLSAAPISSLQERPGKAAARCEALAGLAGEAIVIEKAELVPQGPLAGPSAGPPSAGPPPVLPEHCLVRGTIAPRTGFGGRKFGIGFEVRMPTDWNQRFMFQGGGGLDGVVQPAIGNVANSQEGPALAQGFAVASTDSGHSGSIVDASFGLDQQARTDYAYNALDKVSTEAKRILAAYYGTDPRYSYFVGCSNGGGRLAAPAARIRRDRRGRSGDALLAHRLRRSLEHAGAGQGRAARR